MIQVAENRCEWLQKIFRTSNLNSRSLSLATWYKRFGYLNSPSLKQHLNQQGINYIDDIKDLEYYNNCQCAKATKIYNWS